jgi:succinate dehydrogenase/fumarate reductase flavoprotein subunit
MTETLARRLAAPPPSWHIEADVVVVGSGVAGLTTALRIAPHSSLRIALVTKDVPSAGRHAGLSTTRQADRRGRRRGLSRR